jgi:hypothetical protein
MSSSIPTSTFVSESAVIDAPFSDVWHLIKLPDFSKFWSALDKSEWVKGTSDEADVVKWSFKDGSALEVKQEEHSVSCDCLLRVERILISIRASITTSHTASSRPSQSCLTPLSSPRSARTRSLLASMREQRSSPGRAISRAMPTLR